jgi:hypothetical protein
MEIVMKRKTVTYAYPTSTIAKKLNRYNEGCYVVKVEQAIVAGPFEAVDQAEAHANTLPQEWDLYYMRYPLPGSQFLSDNKVA